MSHRYYQYLDISYILRCRVFLHRFETIFEEIRLHLRNNLKTFRMQSKTHPATHSQVNSMCRLRHRYSRKWLEQQLTRDVLSRLRVKHVKYIWCLCAHSTYSLSQTVNATAAAAGVVVVAGVVHTLTHDVRIVAWLKRKTLTTAMHAASHPFTPFKSQRFYVRRTFLNGNNDWEKP